MQHQFYHLVEIVLKKEFSHLLSKFKKGLFALLNFTCFFKVKWFTNIVTVGINVFLQVKWIKCRVILSKRVFTYISTAVDCSCFNFIQKIQQQIKEESKDHRNYHIRLWSSYSLFIVVVVVSYSFDFIWFYWISLHFFRMEYSEFGGSTQN